MRKVEIKHLPLTRCCAIVVMLASWVSVTHAKGPQYGEVQRIPVISLLVKVGNLEKDSKRATYTPPPGWYVRSHSVACIRRYGNASYSVSTVPAGWKAASDGHVADSYRQLLELNAKVRDVGFESKLNHSQETTNLASHDDFSSHHALMVEATAQGEGRFRGGSGIELMVTAELVYLGTDSTTSNCPRLGFAELK